MIITASGSGYGAPPSVVFTTPPGGDFATGTAVLTGGKVTSVTITHAGSLGFFLDEPNLSVEGFRT